MFTFPQVCDSDTVLDPACTIEMLKILEEDPMVGGVGGDVQVKSTVQRDQSLKSDNQNCECLCLMLDICISFRSSTNTTHGSLS